MLDLRRSLRAAATAALAAAAVAMPALAQQAQPAQPSDTVGPPGLKDFQLPGQRTTPPAPDPEPQPQPRTPAAERPAERPPAPAAERPATRIAPTPAAPAGTAPATRAAPSPAPGTDAPTPAAPPAANSAGPATDAAPSAPAPDVQVPAVEPDATGAAEAAPADAGRDPSSGFAWLWPALALLAAAAMLLGWLRLRRRREEPSEAVAEEVAPVAAPAPAPEPAAVQEPAPAAPALSERRAWLEVDIKAERAAATDREAMVDYELLIDNVGAETARNIRIDARLFNAGAEADIAAFFRGPIHEESGSPHVTVPPGRGMKLTGKVALPMGEVTAVEIQGRRLFIPMVAINVAYDWGEGGTGRTSRSWLVGREAEGQSAKMGAFRLDLGPRIYRSVGQREAALVKV